MYQTRLKPKRYKTSLKPYVCNRAETYQNECMETNPTVVNFRRMKLY